jgi:hypothetical protein
MNIQGVPGQPLNSLTAGLTTPHDDLLHELRGEGSSQTAEVRRNPQRVFHPETLDNPFDGSPLGSLTLPDSSQSLHQPGNKTEELWVHLSRVLELQRDIAKRHVSMEGIGNKAVDYGKGVMKTKGTRGQSIKSWAASGAGAINSNEEEDEGVDVKAEADEEEVKTREREEEFAQLADQFEGRKEVIHDIMAKVGSISLFSCISIIKTCS